MDLALIPTFLKQQIFNSPEKTIRFVLIFFIIMASIALLHGSITQSIVTPTSILVMTITCGVVYIYFKQQFSNKIKKMDSIIKKYRNPTILDEVCKNNWTNMGCQKYREAKRNFYKISNIILEKADI